MKLKRGDPSDPKVTDAIVEMLRKMTPEEAEAFISYRTPGVEETDMTGMLRNGKSPNKTAPVKCRVSAR